MPLNVQAIDMVSRLSFRKRVLTTVLLSVWVCVNFVLPFLARDLSFTVWGWPLHFWLSAQGSVLVFLVIVTVYAWLVNRWEAQETAQSSDSTPPEGANLP
jgi:putative solute:sodium symporter small subunit